MPISTPLTFFYYFAILALGKAFFFSALMVPSLEKEVSESTPFLASLPYSDTLRALIVFTQFRDDTYPGDPQVFQRRWPLSDRHGTLPPFARDILAPSPTPPFPAHSLTDYFYRQSLGQFVLFGETYDSVLVTRHPESSYHRPNGSYADLTRELLNRIDRYGFDFSKYDQNRDGLIDHIFIVVRGDSKRDAKEFVWTGASCLDGRCSASLVSGNPQRNLAYDGKRIDWNRSGSYIMHRTPGNIDPLLYHVRLMAHEIGHDLWASHFVHIPANRSNDVPLKHNRGSNSDCVGYLLMAGAGGAWDCGGSETISAYERSLLGWIDCTPLDETGKNIRIGDLYTTSDCYTIDLDDRRKRLFVSNLQRIGFFDQTRRIGQNKQFEVGLRTTGLLVHFVNGRGVDVLPADNELNLGTENATYEGDLFGPQTASQLTPWTRPNINGYTTYPRVPLSSWAALDNIRFENRTSKAMIFDYYTDFREAPTVREDSWIGDETKGYTFLADLKVTDASTLTINTDIVIRSDLIVEGGSSVRIGPEGTLHILPGSTIELKRDANLDVEGTMILDGVLVGLPGANLAILDGGAIRSNVWK